MAILALPDAHGYNAKSTLPDEVAHSVLSTGDPVYLNGSAKWQLAIAVSLGTVADGIVVIDDAASADDPVTIATSGKVGGWPASTWTAGGPVFLSQTVAGQLTQTRPSDPNLPIFLVGRAVSDTEIALLFQIIQDEDAKTDHENLDTLVHEVVENFHEEVIRTSNKLQQIIWWTDNGKTQKIREIIYTRSPVTTGKIASVVTNQYDQDGNLITNGTGTLTETINRTANKVTSVDAVKS
jgi:hypothetical protein